MINIGSFVYFRNNHIWSRAQELGCLSEWEIDHPDYITGQVIGTYGPWEHVPNSKFHWSIFCDCTLLIKQLKDNFVGSAEEKYARFGFAGSGSSQIEPDFVHCDVVRNREWKLSILTQDFTSYCSAGPLENVIEKEILHQARQPRWVSVTPA